METETKEELRAGLESRFAISPELIEKKRKAAERGPRDYQVRVQIEVRRLTEKYGRDKCRETALFHFLSGGTPPNTCTSYDFLGGDSIEGFFSEDDIAN